MLSQWKFNGITSPFEDLHSIRPKVGQLATARNICNLLEGSKNTTVSDQQRVRYTLRCIPQIHGAKGDSIAYVKKVEIETLSQITQRLPKKRHVISGGNPRWTNGATIWLLRHCLLSEIGNVSGTSGVRLVNSQLSKLPSFWSNTLTQLRLHDYPVCLYPLHRKIKFYHPASVDSNSTRETKKIWERPPLVKQQKFLKTHVASLLLKSWQLLPLRSQARKSWTW